MVDVSIGNETSPEANRQTEGQADDGQTGGQTGKPICREAAPPKIGLFSCGPCVLCTAVLFSP